MKNVRQWLNGLRRTAARRRRGRGDAGMTLLEILIVLALLGLVMGTIGFAVNNQRKKGQLQTAKIAANQIAQACIQYMLENSNNCPTSMQDLVTNKNLPKPQKDPWGTEFTIKCPGSQDSDGAEVISAGPDRQAGSEDDVKSGS